MKKWLIYAVALVAVALLGMGGRRGEDVSRLHPVQLLVADYQNEKVTLTTDAGYVGTGKNVQSALEDMMRSAPCHIFIDTADYLLVRKNAVHLINQFGETLRPSCAVCILSGSVEPGNAAQFLQYHVPKVTMGKYEAGERTLPQLVSLEGRMELVQ